MTPLEFLTAVVAPSGFIAVAVKTDKGFKHKVVESHALAIKLAVSLSAAGEEVYFALGTLKERFVMTPQKEGPPKRQVRVGSNIHQLQSLFIDIDIDPSPGRPKACYATQAQALKDLKRVCEALDFPKPIVVQSGGASGGLHVYWPLTRPLDATDWHQLAVKFKAALTKLELQQDPSRTSDRSSVLRIPGTMNQKRGEHTRIVMDAEPHDPDLFHNRLDAFAESNGMTMPIIPEVGPAFGAAFEANLIPTKPVSFEKMVRGCRQLQQAAKDRGNVSEPLWYIRLQLARFAENGEKACHFLSNGHPGYSALETDKKIAQLEAKGIGPTLCTTFEAHDPAPCSACPHRGDIKSPIVLGMEIPEALHPVQTEVEVDGQLQLVTIPKPPFPFKRRQGGGIFIESEGDEPPKVIYEHDLYPIRRLMHDGPNKEETVWRVHLPKDGIREFNIPAGVSTDQRACISLLADKGVYISPSKRPLFMTLITNWIHELQREKEAQVTFSQLGWRDKSFVAGDVMFTPGGPVLANSDHHRPLLPGLNKAGTHEEWSKALMFLRQPGMEAFAFAFLSAYGSPLLVATELTGAVINLVGESGGGKTTCLRAAASVWGDWNELVLNGDKMGSSIIGRMNRLGMHNNLPVMFDEVTNLPPAEASSLVYSVSVGKGRITVDNKTMREKDNVGRWRLIMMTSSNLSLYDKFSVFKKDASAEMARLLECPAPQHHENEEQLKRDADAMLSAIGRNYGWSGRIYIEHVVKNRDKVFARVAQLIARIDKFQRYNTLERFWIGMISVNIVGGMTAMECGALGWSKADMDRILHWAVTLLRNLSNQVKSQTGGFAPRSLFGDFLAEHNDQFLVITRDGNDVRTIRNPSREFVGTLEVSSQTLWVRRAVFQKWLVTNGINSRDVVRSLMGAGMLRNKEVRKNLSYGTNLPPTVAHCYAFKLDPEDDGELLDKVGVSD